MGDWQYRILKKKNSSILSILNLIIQSSLKNFSLGDLIKHASQWQL